MTTTPPSATPISTQTQPPEAPPDGGGGRLRGVGSVLGIVISVVALAGVVWWALRQDPPRLPHGAGQLGALAGAIALYGLNTLVRSERWHRLLLDDGAQPARADSYALTTIGYAVNNVLPARAGDAARVVLMAPRAAATRRTVLGTIVAERLLDVGVILVLFLVVGYAILGNVGAGSVEWIALATVAVIAGAALAVVLMRRNERIHAFVAPMLSSTARLLSAHGALLVVMTFGIWLIEAAAWIAVGASVGFHMSFLEGLYLVALASVFALIPSGPGYAGTQDAATVIGIKAIGGTGATAVSYLVMLRFALLVPITAVGLLLLVLRYGGFARARAEGA
jgi:glycosyltransferase 2 family protein